MLLKVLIFVVLTSFGHATRLFDDVDEVSVILKVKDEEGRAAVEAAKRDAKRNNCPSAERFDVACLSMNPNAIQGLKNNPHLEFDYDSMVYKDGWPDEETDSNLRHRNLAEETPYGINMVNAYSVPGLPSANWKNENGSPIRVCIVDTGYSPSHPDLPDSTHVSGANNANGEWDKDKDSHGTHCAGTVAAIGGNDEGVIGVLPGANDNATLYITRGLNDRGSSTTSNVMEAVAQCDAGGANIISMSLGGGSYNPAFRDLLDNLHHCNNIIIVAAAGNTGQTEDHFPASYPGAIAVASVDSSGDKSSFSTMNDQVEVAAPGRGVKSTTVRKKGKTYTYGYSTWSGTSMATPHVAGVIAKVWSKFPTCNSRQIRRAVAETSAGSNCGAEDLGHGIIDLQALHDHVADNYVSGECTLQEGTGCGGCMETASCTYNPPQCPAPPSPTPPPPPPPPTPPPPSPTPPPPTPAPPPTPSCGGRGTSCVKGENNCCPGLNCGGKPGSRTCR